MIVRFFKTGTSNGEAPVRYLLSTKDHTGQEREHRPEVLEGSPALTIDLINGIDRKYKYASGCLAFRSTEQPTRSELLGIIDQFKKVVAPGLEADQFNALFVLHREAEDKKTGQAGFHVHFVLPMTILGGKNSQGKDLAGKRWNPHPPGKQTIEVMSLFTQITNHENGWKQVQERPKRLGINSMWRKADQFTQKQKAELLHKEVLRAVHAAEISSRPELLAFMEDKLGLTVTRAGDQSVSVKFPGTPKAIRLRGAVYEAQTDFQALRHQRHEGSPVMTGEDYRGAKLRLSLLLDERAQHTTNTNITTRRRDVYGKRGQKILRTGTGSTDRRTGGAPWREAQHLKRKNSLERDLLQTGRGQWLDPHGGGHQKTVQGLWGPAGQPPETSGKSHPAGGIASQSRARRGQSIPTINHAADLDEQIRSLGVLLNDFPLDSLEATAITDQINVLRGEKGRLPKGPRMKP